MIFRFGDYEIDSGRYELRCKGEGVALEPKSLDVLLHLVQKRDRLVSKQELLDTVWAGVHVTESTLTRAIAIHDTAQVAGAALLYAQQHASPLALETATVTKLVRNLFLLAVIPLIALGQRRSGGRGAARGRPPLRQLVPLFVAGFAALALVRTLGDLWATAPGTRLDAGSWQAFLGAASATSSGCLAVSIAGIGLSTRLGQLRRLGLQPLAAGFAAALTVGGISAALLLATS